MRQMMYKIYVPEDLTYFYADEFGERYESPSGDVVEAPYTEAEALSAVRALRNQRLYDCDWTQLPDAPLSDAQKEQWRTYRQALRDMMDDFAWGLTTWPEP
jgi:hypothetical protein